MTVSPHPPCFLCKFFPLINFLFFFSSPPYFPYIKHFSPSAIWKLESFLQFHFVMAWTIQQFLVGKVWVCFPFVKLSLPEVYLRPWLFLVVPFVLYLHNSSTHSIQQHLTEVMHSRDFNFNSKSNNISLNKKR